jgi:AraC-like DNA-binding protein
VRSYEVLHIFWILQSHVPVPCSIAPVLPGSSWAAVCARDLLIRLLESRADGGGSIRKRYDDDNAKRVVETHSSRLSNQGARHDLTVPVIRAGRVEALLCAGPFLVEPPSPGLVAREWQLLFGSRPHPLNAAYLTFARAMLELEVLDADALAAYREVLELLSQALIGHGDARHAFARVGELRSEWLARLPRALERKAAQLIDTRLIGRWAGGRFGPEEAREIGFELVPNAVLAATLPGGTTANDGPVKTLLDGRTFQTVCAELSRELLDTVVTPLGEQGVYFLSHVQWGRRRAAQLAAVRTAADRISEGIRARIGATPVIGIGSLGEDCQQLPRLAREARAALDRAIWRGSQRIWFDESRTTLVSAPDEPRALNQVARSLRKVLDHFANGSSADRDLALDEYLEILEERCAGDPGAMRAYLECVLSPLVDQAQELAGLDDRSIDVVAAELESALMLATGTPALLEAAKSAVRRLGVLATQRSASREVRLDNAMQYIDASCAEPLTVAAVARRAGLSAAHFSVLFKATYGVTFSEHLQRARFKAATRLLRSTSLSAAQVAKKSGFASVTHFHRVFKQQTGLTPGAYRARAG